MKEAFKDYANVNQKIAHEVHARHLDKIKKGFIF